MASLPNKTFLCNYNARDFVAATNTLPKTEGQIFNEDIVLYNAPTAIGNGYISVNGSTMGWVKVFSSVGDNPFNRSGSDPLTIVAKISVNNNRFCSVFGNEVNNTNWRLRQESNGQIYLSASSSIPSLNLTTTSANTVSFVIDNNTYKGVSWTDNVNSSGSFSWGASSQGIYLFRSSMSSYYWSGNFYWLYISPEALTDAEIQKVINYNEGVGISVNPDEINLSKWGDEAEITVDSETDWTASTTDSWISFSPTEGESGTSVITVSGGANRGDATRSASIDFIDADENTAEVTIMQPRIINEVPINKLYKGTLKLN